MNLKKILEKLKGYLNEGYLRNVQEIFNSNIKLPYYLYAKILLRIYTAETPFYTDVNKALLNERFSFFTIYNYSFLRIKSQYFQKHPQG